MRMLLSEQVPHEVTHGVDDFLISLGKGKIHDRAPLLVLDEGIRLRNDQRVHDVQDALLHGLMQALRHYTAGEQRRHRREVLKPHGLDHRRLVPAIIQVGVRQGQQLHRLHREVLIGVVHQTPIPRRQHCVERRLPPVIVHWLCAGFCPEKDLYRLRVLGVARQAQGRRAEGAPHVEVGPVSDHLGDDAAAVLHVRFPRQDM
mmetsp:Transcript_100142/g.238759  ORF Transcript_100142/g.238759 Transcript_100142/m.238759 type:complete len:202 (-) Transcript_100142:827-1432(-)